jgi:nitrogen fixation protein NifB
MTATLSRHPCFDASARHEHARVHLPVAAGCNVQCNFCDRQGDCVNESRPGITSALLTPEQAVAYLDRVREVEQRLSVVGIAGPGDPFASGDLTVRTLELVRERHPDLLLCVASNGVGISPYVDDIARLKVGHVTLTINAVDPAISAKIYAWVRHGKRMIRGQEAGETLIELQATALRLLVERGVIVKVNTIVIPGVNEHHVMEVARAVSKAGASVHNLMPLYPVATTPFASIPTPGKALMDALRAEAGQLLPQMRHCTRCRADAVGLIGDAMTPEKMQLLQLASRPVASSRPHVAIATREGVMVNQHLGDADRLWIFALEAGVPKLVEQRTTPAAGDGDGRWAALAALLHDCGTLVTSGAGAAPTRVLGAHGITVTMADSLVDEAVSTVLNGGTLRAPSRKFRCGDGCRGDSTGCG